jgi:DNA-directed RNA polymerase subunit RPC12/RpoP
MALYGVTNLPKQKESLHFSCCFCGKEMPTGKYIPINFGIVCQDCSIELRRLKREVKQ